MLLWRKHVLQDSLMGKCSQVSVLGKSFLKTSNKDLRPKPLYSSCKEYYFYFLNKWSSIAFLRKCKDCPHCHNNGFLLIKIIIPIIINNFYLVIIKSLFALFRFLTWSYFTIGSIFQDLLYPLFHFRLVTFVRCLDDTYVK